MQTKKIIGVALVAAIVSSASAVAASATSVQGKQPSKHTFGVIGAFNSWAEDAAALTDPDGDGVYVGVVKDVEPGSYEFKVRADGDWDLSWGVYEATDADGNPADRTQNSQTNLKVDVTEKANLVVTLDTNVVDPAALANANSSASKAEEDEIYNWWPVSYKLVTPQTLVKSFGVVGDFNSWSDDVALTDDDGDGVYVGKVKKLEPGTYTFKVRADGGWDLSWGVYEATDANGTPVDRTQNSQTNLSVTVDKVQDLIVSIDTTSVDPAALANADSSASTAEADELYNWWPVTYRLADPTDDDDKNQQSSQESSDSEETTTIPKASGINTDSGYDTVVTDYIYFDNSTTKWDEVYAYWWNETLGETYDKLDVDENGVAKIYPDYERDENGEILLDSEGNKIRNPWPGLKMTKINDTDVWQIRVPYGADKIIFSNGKLDADLVAVSVDDITPDQIAYQTANIEFDAEKDAGKVYAIVDPELNADTKNVNWRTETGPYKNKKFIYLLDNISIEAYDGEFLSEHFEGKPEASIPEKDNDESSEDTETIGDNSDTGTGTGTGTATTTTTTTTDVPQTGDVAMAVAFISVAAAALGAVVLAAKKRERN